MAEEPTAPTLALEPFAPLADPAATTDPEGNEIPRAAAARRKCRATSLVNDLNVRSTRSPTASSRGEMYKGDQLEAWCSGYNGQTYTACGGSGETWIAVRYQGDWGYVPSLCVRWEYADNQ